MNGSLTIAYFLLMFGLIVVTHKLEENKQDVRPALPDPPTEPPHHPHHEDADTRRRRYRAFDLGTTENVSPELFVAYERQGYFVALTPMFTNSDGQQVAIVVVAHSEDDYLLHEAAR